MIFPKDESGQIDICILNDGAGDRIVDCLTAKLRDVGSISLLNARPCNVEPPLIKSVQGLAARLASTEFRMRDGRRLVIVTLGPAGEAIGRALAAHLLGQNVVLEAVYSLFIKSDDDSGESVRETFTHIDFETVQMCWNEQEDRRRIKRLEVLTIVEGAEHVRMEIDSVGKKPKMKVEIPLLLPLRPSKGCEAEIFCIPGAGASVISFLDLVQLVPDNFSMLGLQPRGLDARESPYSSVEAAAIAFEELIIERGSNVAIHLVGHSYGGCIAFELASRLRVRGNAPASLTLIDTRPPRDSLWPVDLDDAEVALGWIRLSEQAAEQSLCIDEKLLKSNDILFNLRLIQDGMIHVGLLPSNTMDDTLVGPMRMFAACVRNWYHTTMIYPEPLRLIYLDDPQKDETRNAETAREVSEKWSRLAPQVSFCRGSGNHITGLKSPHAKHLVKLMGWESIEELA